MLERDWPVPSGVNIAMTDRHGGVSLAPYDSLNLGVHVGDDVKRVQANRELLSQTLQLPNPPVWLEQVHGTHVHVISTAPCSIKSASQNLHIDSASIPIADGSYTQQRGQVCAVMTADCLPILLCNRAGTEVSALHAGWRGLCDGIIEQGVAQFTSTAEQLVAFLGPAIGPLAFEVGAEVRHAFLAKHPQAVAHFSAKGDKYLADLEGLATMRLSLLGVTEVYCANTCTFSSSDYFSYRRDHVTGRLASLIWLDERI